MKWYYKPWMLQTKCSVYFLMNATSPDDYHVVDKVEVHPSEVRGSQDYIGYITANCVGELQGNSAKLSLYLYFVDSSVFKKIFLVHCFCIYTYIYHNLDKKNEIFFYEKEYAFNNWSNFVYRQVETLW